MPRLAVLFVNHGADVAGGGAELSLLELVEALHLDGRVEPVVTVQRDGEMAAALERIGARHIRQVAPRWVPFDQTTFERRLWRARVSLSIVKRVPAWVRLLREQRPDVVVTNTAVTPVAALACRMLGIPHVWWVQEFVTRDHRLIYALGEPLSQRMIGMLSRRVVVNSQAMKEYYSRRISTKRLQVIYYGIDAPATGPNTVDEEPFRLLLLGRQTGTKGSELAVRALAKARGDLPEVRLRLVGAISAPYREHLEAVAGELGVGDALEIIPFTRTPARYLDWCNVLLMCSTNEAFGRVTVEALKAGRPVIGARSGGTPELIADGVNGLLFNPGDADQLASAICTLGSHPELVEAMSEAAAAGAAPRFTRTEEVDNFVDLFRTIARRREQTIP